MSPCNIRPSSRGCDCRYTSYYSKHTSSSTNWIDGWIGHPLDPVGCIFDTLAEASLILDDNIPYTPSFFGNGSLRTKLKYILKHVGLKKLSINP